jgi:hypothetical protein
MKKYIFILIIFITSKVFCQSNFPDSNAIWNVNYINSVGTPTDEMLYGLKGDTLINDTLYNKLYTLSDTTLSNENMKDYIGSFRQEGHKVWFKPAYWISSDILLYDFSASVGDTVWHNGSAFYNNEGQITFDFGYIYSVILEIEVNGLRTYKVERKGEIGGAACEWYAGIGSNFGLFGSIIQFPLIGDTYNLACFKHNDTVKYENNLMCNKCFCSGLSGIDEKKNNSDWLSIFPNPTQNSLTIEVQKLYSKIVVEIIDEKGSIIYKKESLDSPITLNASIHGIYFIKLSVDNETITRKIIIQ